MKKFISVLAALTVVSVISTNIYAASININKAEKTDTDAVSVMCTVNNPDPYQEITVISREQNSTDSADLIYIDQYSKEMTSTDNTFSFEFSPASWSDFANTNKVYIVRIGGSSVDEPADMIIASSGGEVVYAVGDINGDEKVDKEDAILLLKYTSSIIDLSQSQVNAGDVNKDSKVDIRDVTAILNNYAKDIDTSK